jgi:hypothetical protein
MSEWVSEWQWASEILHESAAELKQENICIQMEENEIIVRRSMVLCRILFPVLYEFMCVCVFALLRFVYHDGCHAERNP